VKIIGNDASSAIQAIALLIFMDKGIDELAECVHPHPSITEGIQECVRMLLGNSMWKPDALRGKLSCRINVHGVSGLKILIRSAVINHITLFQLLTRSTLQKMKSVTVFCGSSSGTDPILPIAGRYARRDIGTTKYPHYLLAAQR
jgi:hypothetical protein